MKPAQRSKVGVPARRSRGGRGGRGRHGLPRGMVEFAHAGADLPSVRVLAAVRRPPRADALLTRGHSTQASTCTSTSADLPPSIPDSDHVVPTYPPLLALSVENASLTNV